MKHLPNCITLVRILGAIGLLFVRPFSLPFFLLYGLCGVTDALDGYAARKLNAGSRFGQVLDSVADLLFIVAALAVLVPALHFPAWLLYWVASIAAVRGLSLVAGLARYRKIAFLHTYANKAAGFLLFLFPFLVLPLGKEGAAIAVCGVASVSALEELLLNVTAKTLNRDRPSFFIKQRRKG